MTTLTADLLTQINYWAVLVAGLATFFLGGLWYSPALFENAWMQANGITPDQVKALQASLGPSGFAGTFAAYLVMALILALLLALLGIESATGGIVVALAIWLGFVATTGLTVNLFSVRPLSAWVIDAGFQALGLILTGAILGLWR